jgi:hypothetical protein
MSAHRAAGFARHGSSLVVFIWLTLVAPLAASEPLHGSADALLAIDQQRASDVQLKVFAIRTPHTSADIQILPHVKR